MQEPHDSNVASIMQLLDELQWQIDNGRRFRLMNVVGVDEQQTTNIIDRLRMTILKEIELARRIVQDRQQIMMDAHRQAQKMLAEADEQVKYLVSDHGITAESKYYADQRLRQSQEDSVRMREAMNDFAIDVMDLVEKTLEENLERVAKAKAHLNETTQKA